MECSWKLTLRVFNLLVALLFLASAALQYNDGDDAWIWFLVYLLAALLSGLAELRWREGRKMVWRPLVALFSVSCFAGSIVFFIRVVSQGRAWDSADGYDCLGLLLVSWWMALVLALEFHGVLGPEFAALPQHHEDEFDHL